MVKFTLCTELNNDHKTYNENNRTVIYLQSYTEIFKRNNKHNKMYYGYTINN